jgi:hypothetical protein
MVIIMIYEQSEAGIRKRRMQSGDKAGTAYEAFRAVQGVEECQKLTRPNDAKRVLRFIW